nr:PCRF domain-containing protein [Candidatus Saccharibacteria bacterium]
MKELEKALQTLLEQISDAISRLDISAKESQIATLSAQSAEPDFWQDSESAQQAMKQQAKLTASVEPWRALESKAKEALELTSLHDAALQSDLEQQKNDIAKLLAGLKKELQFSAPYDEADVILSIYAGAGGTDAQDWASMLHRMYVRWAEQHDCKVQM